jgi:orotate phosphoribosyltransferase
MDAAQQTEWLRAFIEHKAVFRSPPGELLLISAEGGIASWQFYFPVAVLDPEFQRRMAALFWMRFAEPYKARPFQICACETGGVPVACALQATAYAARQAVPVFAIKKRAKDYGIKNWIEGVVNPRLPVLLVDDVVGGRRTLTQAAERLRSFGLEVQGAFAIAAVKEGPLTFKLAGEERPITVLLGPDAFARTYEQYFAKYGKLPQFEGVLA